MTLMWYAPFIFSSMVYKEMGPTEEHTVTHKTVKYMHEVFNRRQPQWICMYYGRGKQMHNYRVK